MDKKTLRDLDVAGQKVLVRVDFNVPFDAEGNISDDTRIRASLDTIKYLLDNDAAVICMAHLGRPKGEVNPKYTLAPVAKHLGKLLGKKISFAPDCVGDVAKAAAKNLKAGQLLLLENLRFHKEEEKNDMDFAEQLASLADLYVNDGFGVSHRAHASVEGVTHFLPAAAGFLLEKEIAFVGKAVTEPLHPFAAIIGGAKVSDKISVIENLLTKADKVMICGAMAYTFFKALGYEVGKSKCELDYVEYAKGLLEKANGKLILPVDLTCANPTDEACAEDFFGAISACDTKIVKPTEIPADWQCLDCGPETIKFYAQQLEGAKTVVWNGPAGVFEVERYAVGTKAICETLANLEGATTIIGGGDSAAAAISMGYEAKFSHISTGGGASLEYLEGKTLPGVACLDDK